MIWHTETVSMIGQPSDATVELVGIFDKSSDSNPIAIRLQYQQRPEDTISQLTIFEHCPSGRFDPETTADDILERYRGKMIKARRKVMTTEFKDAGLIKPLL